MARFAVFVLLPLVVSGFSGSSVAAGELESSKNPVRRIVSMLQSMAKKIEAEAAKETELYENFGCYCKTNGGELQQSIASSTAKVPQLQSDIEQAEQEVVRLGQELKSHQEDRTAAKESIASATSQREEENKQFLEASGEYKSYLAALGAAIPAIEKGMSGSFLQTATNARLRQAATSDASVTDYDRQQVMAFLTGSSDDGYVPQSGEIVGILKQIEEDFEKSLAEVTEAEEKAVKIYEELMAAKQEQIETLSASIEKKTVRIGDTKVQIANMKNELGDEEAALIADQKFLKELEGDCETKAAEWEERKKVRAEELVAIYDTIKVLNDDDALELFKKTLPSPSLLQVSNMEKVRRKLLSVIRPAASRSHRAGLDFLAMALSGRKVDFSKVMKMIDNMVATLKQEGADDEAKKEYCEKQIDSAEDKAKELSKKIEDLESSIAEKEEAISTLASEIKEISAGIQELDKSVADATAQRKSENEEYTELISSNNAAKELLAFAKNRLNKFYNPALYRAPPKRELSEEEKIYSGFGGELAPTPAPGGIAGTGVEAFVQVSEHKQQRDAPPPPPETFGAYVKKAEETGGVMSMIDLLVKELDKEITEAEVEEKNAQNAYEKMMNDAASKRAADMKSISAKETAKADAEEGKTSDTAAKTSQSKELQATQMYEMQLHSECDWLMQNFDLRRDARSQEIESLQGAKAILAGADFSFAQGSVRAQEVHQLRR